MNKKKELLDLLHYSQKLAKTNKFLADEDPKKFRKLVKFLALIEQNLHLRKKKEYLELINMFSINEISAEDFSFCFIAKHDDVGQTIAEMEQDFEKKFDELSALLIEHKENKLGLSFMFMYDYCDDFDPNSDSSVTDEVTLKNYAQTLASELKRF